MSLTSVCGKVMEHIIHSQVMGHLDEHSILTDRQHGFRRRRSCETELLVTHNDLSDAMDKKMPCDVIILDFTKAFDTVPHERLLLKLRHYGISNRIVSWLRSFLVGRTQRVVLEGHVSSPVTVEG